VLELAWSITYDHELTDDEVAGRCAAAAARVGLTCAP
jgi:hypothetical protein